MNALYYPFHLCHTHTLERLLQDYQTVHFRDFMALQLTSMMGTTAFPDRMGDYHPEALRAGRIIQGYDLNGAMTSKTIMAVNHDLTDVRWRQLFQEALVNDHRFQRGLFPDQPESSTEGTCRQDPEWIQFQSPIWPEHPFDVQTIQTLSHQRLQEEEAARFEYGWAMIKTAASLIYTIRLCQEKNLVAVTDSIFHYYLLAQTCRRDGMTLKNSYVRREGY